MSNAAATQSINTSVTDPYLHAPTALSSSLFAPKPWTSVNLFSNDTVVLTPITQGGTFGSNFEFSLPSNTATYLGGPLVLEFEVSPGAHSNGALAMYDDFLGYSFIEAVTGRYGHITFDTLTGEYIKFAFYNQRYSDEKRESIREEVKGPLSSAERVALFQAGGVVRVEIPLYFTRGLDTVMPQVNAENVIIALKSRTLQECMQGTSTGNFTTTPTISNVKIYVEYIHASSQEQALEQAQAVNRGLHRLIDQMRVINQPAPGAIVAGSPGKIEVPLEALNQPCTAIIWVARTTAQLSTPGQIDRWTLRGGLGDRDFVLDSRDLNSASGGVRSLIPLRVMKRYYTSRPRDTPSLLDDTYYEDFSRHPFVASNAFGSLYLANLSQPRLNITYRAAVVPTALPTIQITAFGVVKNILTQKNGNLFTLHQ